MGSWTRSVFRFPGYAASGETGRWRTRGKAGKKQPGKQSSGAAEQSLRCERVWHWVCLFGQPDVPVPPSLPPGPSRRVVHAYLEEDVITLKLFWLRCDHEHEARLAVNPDWSQAAVLMT